MIVTVTYTQLNSDSCIREVFHNEEHVDTTTLEHKDIPLEVKRLMLMKKEICENHDYQEVL